MIKRFIQGFILGVVTTGAITIGAEIFAQELIDPEGEESVTRSKPVECYASQSVLTMAEDQGYEVFWQGANIKDNYPDNTIVIIINNELNSWMALEMNMEAACILGYGGNFWLFDQYYQNLTPQEEQQ
tara:strand:+ start:3164 stop:3547 length:384 start_codon:yes stop_codon:yes gene_type:complete